MVTGAQPSIVKDETESSILRRTRGSLLRILGVGFGLAVIVGNTIGAGILKSPGVVASLVPVAWLFLGVWVIGGVYALLGSFAISELSTMIPRDGGYYVFARRAFGEYPAFIVGWTDWMAQCGTTAAVALVAAEYTGDLYPHLAGHLEATACGITILFGALQWRGVSWGSAVQNLTTAAKALCFMIFVVAAFVLAHPTTAPVAPRSLATGMGLVTAVILALQAVIYSYDGWYGVMYFSEEVQEPGKNIPRSMIGGVFSLMAIYLLVNGALLYVLPSARLAGESMAMGTVMTAIFGPRGDTIIRIVMVISMLSSINAYHLMASRIPFAMSRDGLLPKQVTEVNRGGTPTMSLLLSVLAAVLFILGGQFFKRVAAILAFVFVVDYAMAYLGVFKLRRKEPDAERPYRAWGYPWTTGLALLGSVLFLVGAIYSDTENSLWAVGVLALSYPLYLVTQRLRQRKDKPASA